LVFISSYFAHDAGSQEPKDQVNVPPLPASIPELKVRIRTITADMLQTVWNEIDYRVDVCRITNGAYTEHLQGM